MSSRFDINNTNRFSFCIKYVAQIIPLLELGIKFNKLNFILNSLLLYLAKYICHINNSFKSFKSSLFNT